MYLWHTPDFDINDVGDHTRLTSMSAVRRRHPVGTILEIENEKGRLEIVLRTTSTKGPSDNDRTPLLKLENVVTYYGSIKILKDVSLEVFQGEVVSLLGGNASGKTTTMKSILGLVKPLSGAV